MQAYIGRCKCFMQGEVLILRYTRIRKYNILHSRKIQTAANLREGENSSGKNI